MDLVGGPATEQRGRRPRLTEYRNVSQGTGPAGLWLAALALVREWFDWQRSGRGQRGLGRGRLLCYACVHWLIDVNSSAAREALGSELRRMREVIGLSGMAVAAELQWSQSKVSRIEAGRLGVSLSDLSALLRTYGASEEVTAELLTMAAAGGGKAGAWIVQAGGTVRRQGEVAAIEARVRRIRQYSLTTVPGLLQSPAYTAAMARVGNFGDPAALVKARAARQSLLGAVRRP